MPVSTVSFQRKHGEFILSDLWFMVGSVCNLRCIHCYVDSSPDNNSLEQLMLSDVRQYLEEASRYGVRSIYFTGGEPFINREIIPMLQESLRLCDVTVLTNATTPIVRYLNALQTLYQEFGSSLTIRVSMDHYIESRHDAIRGAGTFRKTVENTMALCRSGMCPVITVTPEVFRGNHISSTVVAEEFRRLFQEQGADVSVKILPAVLEMGAQSERRDEPSPFQQVTDERLQQLSIGKESLMCYNGRSVLKKDGVCRVYPCPIIYELPEFDLGATLEESFRRPVRLAHRACSQYCCIGPGQSTCTN